MTKDRNVPYGKISNASEIGQLMRQRRRELGKNQQDIAWIAGVGVRLVSELENGKETAEIGKALLLLERLGLDVWIFPRGQDGLDGQERR